MTNHNTGGSPNSVAIALALSLGLTGCAAPSPQDYSERIAEGGPQQCNSITEDDIDTDTGATTAGGAAFWGIIGAAAGALLGVAGGGDGSDVAKMAAVGGTVGAVAGGVDGYDTAQQKKRFALQEARLTCQLQAAQEDNEKLDEALAGLQASIDKNIERIATLQADYDAKRISAEEARAELASIDGMTSDIERSIARMKSRNEQYESARDANNQAADNTLNTAELDRNINDLNRKIATAESALDTLVERRKVAQIG
jgi:ribosome-associated translation inhibitor RaiA